MNDVMCAVAAGIIAGVAFQSKRLVVLGIEGLVRIDTSVDEYPVLVDVPERL